MPVERYPELDALRGLAAVSVFAFHLFSIFPASENGYGWAGLFNFSPFRLLWDGHAAVVLFFVLSGFVLSLSWINGNPPAASRFILKRICRIWIPYAVSVFVALALRTTFSGHDAGPGVTEAFRSTWSGPLPSGAVALSLTLVGYFDTTILNGVAWSLVHEMRISLAFPALAWLACRLSWRRLMSSALAVSFIAGAARKLIHPRNYNDILTTFHFAAFFALGWVLAAHMGEIKKWVRSSSATWRGLLAAGAVLLYTYDAWFLPRVDILHLLHIGEWFMAAGSALVIVCALSLDPFARFLRHPVPMWLGRISYSLYLYHLVILLALVHQFGAVRGALLSVPVAFAVAAIAYRVVEKPSIAIGRLADWRDVSARPAARLATRTPLQP